jgi:hypothetical protein
MRKTIKRWAGTLVPLGAGAALALGVAAMQPASAATSYTSRCVGDPNTSYCGYQENVYGNAWDVRGQRAVADQPVIVYPLGNGDPAQDFIYRQRTSNPDEREVQYAPNDVASGLCMSDPGGGVRGDSRDGLILRACNGSAFQQFTFTQVGTSGNDAQWTNVATGRVVQPEGTDNQMVTVASPDTGAGSYFGFDTAGSPPPAP